MFGSNILDLAFGLIFTFLVISLVASSATEAVASAMKWRANTLLDGVKTLLNDPDFTGLAKTLYNHAYVNARGNGVAESQKKLSAKPSYINPKHFANALIDIAKMADGTNIESIQKQINDNIHDPQIRTMLNGIVQRAGGNISRVRDEIAGWFDSSMDRISGVYKRKTQLISFLIGFLLVGTLNINTIRVAEALWKEPMIVKSIKPGETLDTARYDFEQFKELGLPYGWTADAKNDFEKSNKNKLFTVFGWLIAALATLFGAPFWFDALQKFVNLRGTGSS